MLFHGNRTIPVTLGSWQNPAVKSGRYAGDCGGVVDIVRVVIKRCERLNHQVLRSSERIGQIGYLDVIVSL